jgi:dipeptidyl-peptidase-4
VTITPALLAASVAIGPGGTERLTPERVFAAPDLSGPHARGVRVAPDGSMVTYLKARADDVRMTDLWAADVAGGEPRRLIDARALMPKDHALSEAEKTRRERLGVQSRGVVDYDWDEQGRFILVPVEGDLWLYARRSGTVSRLTHGGGDRIDAKVSPKGRFVSFVRADDLYVMPSAGGAERALTSGGNELESWATAEFIAQEEMDRSTGYWWSPDERRIALTHVDQRGVDVVERFDIGASGATVVRQRYPRTGRPNAKVSLHVVDVATKNMIAVDLGANADIYVARVDWSQDGKTLYVQRESRDQRRLDLLAANPATGASHVILSETSSHWIELSDDFRPLKDGSFLWPSERSGYRHLSLHDAHGALIRKVTHGDWPVEAVAGVDEARGVVTFVACKDTPTEQRLYEVSYRAPGEPAALTPAGGWWTVRMAKSGGAFAGTYEDPTTPPRTGFYRADGTLVRWIEQNALVAGHPFYPYAARLRVPAFGTIEAADGQGMWWSMRTPPGFDAAKQYPVLIEVYGGPGGASVRKGWNSPTDQLYLEAGFILFALDNRGTPNRSVAFKTALERKLGTVEVDDQLAGVRYLKTLAYVDPARIGVMGYSYGGYMTLMLLTARDSPFAAGIAGAPPTDWKLYDTHYTERYMGKPAENAAGYAASEVTARLNNLKPNTLLLIHGMADDNVTFDNSTRLMAALQARAISFETMLYPGLRHRAGWTQANQLHRTRTILDFLERTLHPTPAP